MAEIRAVIWDMDGVIADSGPYHLAAWQEILGRRGVKFTAGDFKHSFGLRNDNIIRNTLGKEITQAEVDAIAREKEETFRRLAGGRTKPLPGALELLKLLKKEGFRMAIASSTPAENIELVTGTLGIADCFQVIVNGHDVTEGKPDPQVFLLAAQRLGVKPANCLVIEDAVAGVTAAKRAGMACLAVTNTHPHQKLKEANLIVDTLEKVTIKDIEELIMERSLVLIKPDAMRRGLAGEITARLEKLGLKLVALKMLHPDKALAQRHYAVHKGKPFYDDLVDYISSAPIVAAVFEGEGAVAKIRQAMGATDPAQAKKGTIRGDFGLSIGENSVHGSDSAATAEAEIKLFFTEEEIFGY